MIAEADLHEYLDEIRREVCSRCVERPAGGPPCGPLGKPCGVELHLPQLVASVRDVHSDLIEPYLRRNRHAICETCTFLHGEHCPCPMDTLAVLVVQAIEAVDRRHASEARDPSLTEALPGCDRPEMEEIAQAYGAASGTWTGCDWPTVFGGTGMNLQGWTAMEAVEQLPEAARMEDETAWQAAANWLEEIEERAEQAEAEAALAVVKANAGEWDEAVEHALRAWSLEFNTGRPFRHHPPTWQPLYQAVAVAAARHRNAETGIQVGLRTAS